MQVELPLPKKNGVMDSVKDNPSEVLTALKQERG